MQHHKWTGKTIRVQSIETDIDKFFTERSAEIFNSYPLHKIDEQPWPCPGIPPRVFFTIVYNNQYILLHFSVKEQHVRAIFTNYNDPVYKDSCVEFFLAFNGERAYYNFEFNCIGTALAGYGEGRKRDLLPFSQVREILTQVRFRSSGGADSSVSWELSAAIPFQLFSKQGIKSLSGQACRANFYKCGDDLPEPHYLAWSKIEAEVPDFHLPEYFGQLLFQ